MVAAKRMGRGVVATPAKELRSAMCRVAAGAVGCRVVPRAAHYAEFLSTSASHERRRVVGAGREARTRGGSVGKSAVEHAIYVKALPDQAVGGRKLSRYKRHRWR